MHLTTSDIALPFRDQALGNLLSLDEPVRYNSVGRFIPHFTYNTTLHSLQHNWLSCIAVRLLIVGKKSFSNLSSSFLLLLASTHHDNILTVLLVLSSSRWS